MRQNNIVAVIAAHPDDEILGCGGAIARHIASGDEVHVLIVAEGATSRADKRARDAFSSELAELNQSCLAAHRVLGTSSVKMLDWPDNRLDTVPRLDLIKSIESFLNEHQPNVVYTHHIGDLNIDHQCVHEAVVTAARPIGINIITLLFFEVLSSTEWQSPHSAAYFMPNYFIDIDIFLEKKIEALKCYASEMRPWPHSRSYQAVEYLARFRGVMAGVHAAEAFILGRHIIKG